MNNSYPDNNESSNLAEEQRSMLADFYKKRKLFDSYLTEKCIELFTCPGCGYPTLNERGGYEICSLCNWEDDNQDDDEADEVWGGPNYGLSLTKNRLNIGKQLKDIASEVEGKIRLEPKEVLFILSEHSGVISKILEKVPEKADLNHQHFSQYHQAKQSLLQQLVES